MVDKIKELEDKLAILDFKIELMLKLTKQDLNLTIENCKNIDEFAYVVGLKKDEYEKLNELLASQINFYQSYRHNSSPYFGARQYPKLEDDLNVFLALSKEEYEESIWKIVPKLDGDKETCAKLAKIMGISEMYYDNLAVEIRKAKISRLDKEAKMLHSYLDNKDEIDNIVQDMKLIKQEFTDNIKQVDTIIDFFEQNELMKISIFYNGELWDFSEDDKKVVINENSYIHNVCTADKFLVLDKITNILKDNKCEYHDLFVHLLKSGPNSSKKIEQLQTFYKTMEIYNKNEYIIKTELIDFKQKLQEHLNLIEEIILSFDDYINKINHQ